MRKLLLIVFVFISVFATAQEFKGLRAGGSNLTFDSIVTGSSFVTESITGKDFIPDSILNIGRLTLGSPNFAPTRSVVFNSENSKFALIFANDSLVVSGDMEMAESAKIFIDYCRQYIKLRSDSLETELKKCKTQL